MSHEAVERIIGRAVTDAGFRAALQANPGDVLGAEGVTPDEIQALRSLDWDAVGPAGRELDARISRALLARGGNTWAAGSGPSSWGPGA